MKSTRELSQRWSRLVSQITTPQPMLPGSICQVRMKRKRRDGSIRLSAPVTLHTRKVKGRTVTRSLNDRNRTSAAQAVENSHRFQTVVEEFKALGEQLAQVQADADGSKKNSSN